MLQRLAKLKKEEKGFTLVELIVVIAIIGILAAILMPRFFGFTDNARESAVIAEAKSIRSLTETYYASHGDYPVVNAVTGGFQVQTGGTTTPTFDNSPIFSGTIDIADDAEIADGAFVYTKDDWDATCTPSGNITAVK